MCRFEGDGGEYVCWRKVLRGKGAYGVVCVAEKFVDVGKKETE